jgi:hypothetical protein
VVDDAEFGGWPLLLSVADDRMIGHECCGVAHFTAELARSYSRQTPFPPIADVRGDKQIARFRAAVDISRRECNR